MTVLEVISSDWQNQQFLLSVTDTSIFVIDHKEKSVSDQSQNYLCLNKEIFPCDLPQTFTGYWLIVMYSRNTRMLINYEKRQTI